MKNIRALSVFVALLCACFVSPKSIAQSVYHVAASKIDLGPWRFNPVYTQSTSQGIDVAGFLAIADTSAVSGNNLVAVWYFRNSGSWSSKSWDTNDPWEAIKYLKYYYNISDLEDDNWDVEGVAMNSGTILTPQTYQSGMITDDPLADLVLNSVDRDAIVQLLVNVGYQAASIPVDKASDCSKNSVLDGLAHEASLIIAPNYQTYLMFNSEESLCVAIAGLYPDAPDWGTPNVTKPTKPTTAPTWSPPATVPTTPAWTPNTWSAWSCQSTPLSGGGRECMCRRSRRWGAWETKNCWGFTCIRWHEIIEREHCSTIGQGIACPAAGPPAAGSSCESIYE